MDKVTQQNAALVEQIAASAMALEERSRGLVESVAFFTLAQDRSRPLAPQRPAPIAPSKPRPIAPAARVRKTSGSTAILAHPSAPGVGDGEGDWSSF
jgi:hypothetical protein